MDNFDLKKYLAEGRLFKEENENKEEDIVTFLNSHLDELKDFLKKQFPSKSEEIDSAELVDYDGSDVDATLFASRDGGDQTVPSDRGIALNFAGQGMDSEDFEGKLISTKIGGKDIVLGTYSI